MDVFKRPQSWISAEDAPLAEVPAAEPLSAPARPSKARALLTTDVAIEGYAQQIPLRLYRPEGANGLPVLLYFHGGGFVRGSIEEADAVGRFLAERLPALVVSVGGNPPSRSDSSGAAYGCMRCAASGRYAR